MTTGRKTGNTRYTPLEFTFDEKTGSYIVSAGWGGKTDWYKNALAEPLVTVQVGWKISQPGPCQFPTAKWPNK